MYWCFEQNLLISFRECGIETDNIVAQVRLRTWETETHPGWIWKRLRLQCSAWQYATRQRVRSTTISQGMFIDLEKGERITGNKGIKKPWFSRRNIEVKS
jgi:hypothetical protein